MHLFLRLHSQLLHPKTSHFDRITPNTFCVDLKQVDFSHETGKVMKLDLGPDQRNIFSGNAVKDFKPAEPFKFLGLPDAH